MTTNEIERAARWKVANYARLAAATLPDGPVRMRVLELAHELTPPDVVKMLCTCVICARGTTGSAP